MSAPLHRQGFGSKLAMRTLCACSRAGLSEIAAFRHDPCRNALVLTGHHRHRFRIAVSNPTGNLGCSHPGYSETAKVTQRPLSKHAKMGATFSSASTTNAHGAQTLQHKVHTTKHQRILCPSCRRAMTGECSTRTSHSLYVSHRLSLLHTAAWPITIS